MWKSFVRGYLRFSRRERYGIFSLVAGMMLTCYTPDLLFYFQRRIPVADSNDLKAAVLAFEAANKPAATAQTLFYFDPNTLPEAGWQQLGVPERTALTITKYLSHGGHFRKATDLTRIYSLPPDLCAQLIPYVRIVEKKEERVWERRESKGSYPRYGAFQGASSFPGKRDSARWHGNDAASFTRYRKKGTPAVIDINTADTLAWQTLPGIGPGFARRIVAFRDRLGGFYEVAQVAECYGLADTVFQKIQPFLQIGNSSLIKLDLNLTDEKSLAAHPYIRYRLARLIVQYRSAHAGFKAISELRALPLVDEIIYRKIEHYIEITP
ncbi:MAG: helix-hairpin-helix domain-containing protein [Chitinophaga sp.]|uniref:ComEA family DNA-binding protein n=1 Tax=Chitinophaga sp. TaxID=1869181 RepID=UPI001AFF97AD|nr:helix-hairpin-helix domain-containing protein [Chitinophaga sp.]MBO9732947.1 helix-hairpin-helix domain-containing protein [Chitinophaga sp.]